MLRDTKNTPPGPHPPSSARQRQVPFCAAVVACNESKCLHTGPRSPLRKAALRSLCASVVACNESKCLHSAFPHAREATMARPHAAACAPTPVRHMLSSTGNEHVQRSEHQFHTQHTRRAAAHPCICSSHRGVRARASGAATPPGNFAAPEEHSRSSSSCTRKSRIPDSATARLHPTAHPPSGLAKGPLPTYPRHRIQLQSLILN